MEVTRMFTTTLAHPVSAPSPAPSALMVVRGERDAAGAPLRHAALRDMQSAAPA
ncbi:hypothetical protein GCM10014715_52890 [Streptomyces spiralis]|uniref:Uncharacterized protein n=1 Tax=Streptomyces spiralis TaxID=66376 RepID=A0A919DVW3_9ACTN|nr:hypothetical protein GCM10014715_52890 [Streptomyces spiralis]